MLDIFTREGLILFLYSLPALLLSLSVHEFAHAYIAYKLGDESQKIRGRLTLFPLAHIDIIGFISIALFGFGWGKPVLVDDTKFKNKKRDNMLVSIAGPLSNILLAIVFTALFKIFYVTDLFGFANVNLEVTTNIFQMMYNVISLNIVFAIFNMIPIPPFDGARLLFFILPNKYEKYYYILYHYSFLIIIIFFLTNLGSILINPLYKVLMDFVSFFILL